MADDVTFQTWYELLGKGGEALLGCLGSEVCYNGAIKLDTRDQQRGFYLQPHPPPPFSKYYCPQIIIVGLEKI